MPKSKKTTTSRRKSSTRSSASQAKVRSNKNQADFLHSVTSFSKILAAVLFIALPFVGFALGMEYGRVTSFLYEHACGYDSSGAIYRPYKSQAVSELDQNSVQEASVGDSVVSEQ